MIFSSMSSALNDRGIEAEIRNDVSGGVTGKIAPGEALIELWVVNKDQVEAATERIKEIREQPKSDDCFFNYC